MLDPEEVKMKWYECNNNVLKLARQMHEDGYWNGEKGVSNLLYFFGKPWKYETEWEEYNPQEVSLVLKKGIDDR
jgi:hypothetical protein